MAKPKGIQVDLETEVHPTESVEKVRRALTNLFPDAVFEDVHDGLLRATATSLDKLKERFASQAIRDASRRVLLRGIRPGHIYFSLAKQPAFVNRVNFGEDGPLGDIYVIIRTEDPEAVVGNLTEKHEHDHHDGRPIKKCPTIDQYLANPEE
jgi:predicted RNA binding protein with dsRBD fold (UPF0201 family)